MDPTRWPAVLALGAVTAAVIGCGIESLDSPSGLHVPRGAVELRVEQTGTDPILHAFNAIVDGTDYGPIAPGGSVRVDGLDAEREHGALLGGIPTNCAVADGTTKIFGVREDQITSLLFQVVCT